MATSSSSVGHAKERQKDIVLSDHDQLQIIADNVLDLVSQVELDGTVRWASPSHRPVLGYDPAALVGRCAYDLVHPDDLPAVMVGIRRSIDARQDHRFEFRYRHASGHYIVLESIGRLLVNSSGKPCGAILSSRDVTTRAHLEVALRDRAAELDRLRATAVEANARLQAAHVALVESEARYRDLFTSSVAGVLITSVDGTIQDCNAAFASMFGFESVDAARGSCAETLYVTAGVRNAFLDDLRAKRRLDFRESTYAKLDGTPIQVLGSTSGVFNRAGELIEIRTCLVDITDRVRLQDQMRQAQKMEAVGRLAGSVAHDFNNMLTAIIGYADLLADTAHDRQDLLADIREIKAAGQRAAELTKHLLTFSRKSPTQPRIIDVNAAIRTIDPMLRRLIGEDIEYTSELASVSVRVNVDPVLFEQVVMNLAVNARDAMPTGGRLTIKTSTVVVDQVLTKTHPDAHPGTYVIVRVTDSGSGMSADVREHIFEPFFTTKGPDKGTGLGLSTVYGIVTQAGGFIAVDSAPGSGTSFDVYLPSATTVECVVDEDIATSAIRVGRETILVVDDEAAVLGIVRRTLEPLGYRVLTADSPEHAVALADAHDGAIDAVITDVLMPQMTGLTLAEHLLARRSTMRVLYVSGFARDQQPGLASLPPGYAYLPKPFTRDSLTTTLRELFEADDRTSTGVA